MWSETSSFPKITIGLDLGDRVSEVCEIDAAGQVVRKLSIGTTRAFVAEHFGDRPQCRVILEAGTHSPWISRQISELGHETVVANPTELYGGRWRKKKNDRIDAEYLARLGRSDIKLLYPIQHRGKEAQEHLEIIRARDQVVRCRTKLINHVRGAVKAHGARIGRCSAAAFHHRAVDAIPAELRIATEPVLQLIADLTDQVRTYDRQIERVVAESYPEAVRLMQPKGVGALTALAFMLLIEDPKRFSDSRDVGAYFGLVPRLDESSDSSPQLRITKAGDELGRRLLVSAAQYILGPHGPECDLRRHGEAIAARGGKNAKKRAAVAVARKLAVLLHRLWITNAAYDPDRLKNRRR